MLPSPFHYQEQALLYVPKGMPEPIAPEFVDRAAEEVVRLVELSRGRAFVLFTSHANMNAVAERIAGRVPYPILIQGEAPKARCSTPSARRRTRCCSRRPPSGRASTWRASSSRA